MRELTREGRISFTGFYARRARRILPAATLVTIVTVIASALLLNPLRAEGVVVDARWAVLFGANFHFAAVGADYWNPHLLSPLQHYWSLSVEEQFCLVWPLLLAICSLIWVRVDSRRRSHSARRGASRVSLVIVALGAVVTVSLLASMRQTPNSPSWAYFSILTRCWELALGAIVALSVQYARRLDRRVAALLTWLGVACIVVAAASFSSSTPYPGDLALVPVLGAVAIIGGGSAAASRWGAESLLGTAPFQRLGSWSYSWYLWHWPVLLLAPFVLGHALSVPEGLAVATFSLVLAIISFVFVERPIRRMQMIVRRPALGLAGGGALAACALTAVVPASQVANAEVHISGRPARGLSAPATPAQLTADLKADVKTIRAPSNLSPALLRAAKALPIIVQNGCHLQHAGTKSKPCVYGDTGSRTSVVLFGDSHAAAWFPALEGISEREHWRLVDLTKAGCPPPEVAIDFRNAGGLYTQCTAWRRNAQALIAHLHPALVIASWARYIEEPEARPLAGVPTGYGSTWQNGVAAIFSFLRQNADHTVFISDAPTLRQLAPDCVAGHLSDVRACTTARSAAIRLPSIKAEELTLAKREQINAIDPTSWFCSSARCPVIVGNMLLYRDSAHMSPPWSRFIAPLLENSLTGVIQGKTAKLSVANRPVKVVT